ncbi:MAG: clostripain-related cysteine peptidase [Cyanobacteria bacterium P01_G01_bin.54]
MPYDNNLVDAGEQIINLLARGTQGTEVAVAVQSDYWGDTTMRRRQLFNGTIQEIEVTGEDSSDVNALFEYLNWAYQHWDAQHWAVIVVGHGGKINEVSPDDHRSTHQARTWMGVDQFSKAVSRFNKLTDNRVELLFLQNCNKATLEVIYEARNCARYTLASQLRLGAPNYYYGGFLNRLNDPSVAGQEAAIAIMESEHPSMFHALTLVDNQSTQLIPQKLSEVLAEIANIELSQSKPSDLKAYHYAGETQCDVLAFLNYFVQENRHVQKLVAAFADFLKSSVITHYQTGGNLLGSSGSSDPEQLCGLGLYLPHSPAAISRYQSMALAQEVDLGSLYRKILAHS